MPSVKYAISAYVADGTTTDYLITWDYLDEDHIAVYVDGTSNADPTASHTFVQLNSTTLRITDNLGNAIVSGSEIEIRRETPLTNRAITFADGSALLAADLNKNSDYLLYSMQEVLDTVDAAAQDGALAAQVATEELRDETLALKNTTAGYLATVQSDATDADNHRIAAAASEAAAATSEANAATSETNAAGSASAAATSAGASASQASAAASSASQANSSKLSAQSSASSAANSATAAAASANAAGLSETAAATSEANAEAAWDSFDDRYLGAKASAPTVDNDGDALITGALYWNSTNDTMYAWNGSAWDTLNSTTGIADGATSTQISITDTATTFNRLRLTATDDVGETSTLHAFQIGDSSAENMRLDTNEIGNYINGVGTHLRVQVDGGIVSFGAGAGGPTDTMSLRMINSEFLDIDKNASFRNVTASNDLTVSNNATVTNDLTVGSDVIISTGNLIMDGSYQGIHFTFANGPTGLADVAISNDGEGLMIHEPEDSAGIQDANLVGRKWVEFRDDGGILSYIGYAPNFDSGWFSISTSGSGNNYAINHNLGTRDLHAVTFFRASSGATWFVNGGGSGQAMINGASGTATATWSGYGLEYPSTSQARFYVANTYVFATDNTYSYGGSQGSNRWTSGQARVVLFRIGTSSGES